MSCEVRLGLAGLLKRGLLYGIDGETDIDLERVSIDRGFPLVDKARKAGSVIEVFEAGGVSLFASNCISLASTVSSNTAFSGTRY